jgi:hypothetical protein
VEEIGIAGFALSVDRYGEVHLSPVNMSLGISLPVSVSLTFGYAFKENVCSGSGGASSATLSSAIDGKPGKGYLLGAGLGVVAGWSNDWSASTLEWGFMTPQAGITLITFSDSWTHFKDDWTKGK